MNIRTTVVTIAIACVLSSISFSQSRSWNIVLKNGEEYPNVALTHLGKDTLYISRSKNFSDWVLVDSISEMSRERESALLPATAIGAVSGGVIGYALHPTSKDQSEATAYSTVFGVLVGGGAGYLIGSLLNSDELYDFKSIAYAERLRLIDTLIQTHPSE